MNGLQYLGLHPKPQGAAATEVWGFCVCVGYVKDFLAIHYEGQTGTLRQKFFCTSHVDISLLADKGIDLTTRVVMTLNHTSN